MDISLPNNMETFLKKKLAEGLFSTMDEAITFAVQFAFFENNNIQSRIDALNTEIQKGIDDYKLGNYIDGNTAYDRLMAKYE